MTRVFIALRSIFWATVFVLFWRGIASGARRYDASLGFEMPPGSKALGFVLMIPGAIIVLSCLGVFWIRGRGTAAPFDSPTVFVASGPYRYVRNPMYIGAAFVLAAYGCLERSAAIVVLSFLFLLVMHLFVLLVEEPALESRFGESYLAYKRATNRWLPRRPRSS